LRTRGQLHIKVYCRIILFLGYCGIRRSILQNDITVVSIYVNPTQFGPEEDYDRYPRDLNRDMSICEELGVDVVFAPPDDEIYPAGFQTAIGVGRLENVLEGKFRPGHFKGVATVVMKLFNAIQPDRAYFGEKDYQQLKVIEQLVRDLLVPVQIVPVETVREEDGLACSSRNVYLTPEERESALSIYRSFLLAQEMVNQGEQRSEIIKQEMERFILSHPHIRSIDYIEITDPDLNPKERVEPGDRRRSRDENPLSGNPSVCCSQPSQAGDVVFRCGSCYST